MKWGEGEGEAKVSKTYHKQIHLRVPIHILKDLGKGKRLIQAPDLTPMGLCTPQNPLPRCRASGIPRHLPRYLILCLPSCPESLTATPRGGLEETVTGESTRGL